jgi:hypothetical protein
VYKTHVTEDKVIALAALIKGLNPSIDELNSTVFIVGAISKVDASIRSGAASALATHGHFLSSDDAPSTSDSTEGTKPAKKS